MEDPLLLCFSIRSGFIAEKEGGKQRGETKQKEEGRSFGFARGYRDDNSIIYNTKRLLLLHVPKTD